MSDITNLLILFGKTVDYGCEIIPLERALPYKGLSLDIGEISRNSPNPRVGVGVTVQITCQHSNKLLGKDAWDDNATDNRLTIMCQPDAKFDIPNQLPICLAKCPLEKPMPHAANLIPDAPADSDTWANDRLWYTF